MTKTQFPDLNHLVTKMYEGINRRDYAELSIAHCKLIREALQKYKPQISKPVDQVAYDGALQSAMNQLNELEEFFKHVHNNTKPAISKKTAAQIHKSLIENTYQLEQLSKR